MRHRESHRWFLRPFLVVLAVTILWVGTMSGVAANAHVDVAPQAETEGPQTPHPEGCHAAGGCHQVPAIAYELRVIVGSIDAMLSRPDAMISPSKASLELDTPPPRF